MGIDNRGKDSINKPTIRPNENKSGDVTKLVNSIKDKVTKTLGKDK